MVYQRRISLRDAQAAIAGNRIAAYAAYVTGE
jgi:hypothetical protein